MYEHTIPMRVFAGVLQKWEAALREALPGLATEVGFPPAFPGDLDHIQPITSAPARGSILAPYGYAVIPAAVHAPVPLLLMGPDALDQIVNTFEAGVVGLQVHRIVPRWMTTSSAKAISHLLEETSEQGIKVTLPDSDDTELAQEALDVLCKFVAAEEGDRGESEIQILGSIAIANVADGYMIIDSTRRGRIKVTLPQSERRAVCEAMRDGNAVEVVVQARLSGDGKLHNAKLRSFRDLGSRPDYTVVFEQLWGTAQEVFGGVARDERGIPDPDSAN